MEEKLGLEPAFPNGMEVNNEYGMSKRFYAACAAMQGKLTNVYGSDYTVKELVELSYKFADELLRQENL